MGLYNLMMFKILTSNLSLYSLATQSGKHVHRLYRIYATRRDISPISPCYLTYLPLSKNCERFERFLENNIELIPMFPLI